MIKKNDFVFTIISWYLVATALQFSTVAGGSPGVIFIKGDQLEKSSTTYWSFNGTSEAIPATYPTAMDYWESLYSKQLSTNSSHYTLVDTCAYRYCQLVTLDIINGTIKNYQVKTQNYFKNMTGKTFSSTYIKHYKENDFLQLTHEKYGLNWKFFPQYCKQAISNTISVIRNIVETLLVILQNRMYFSVDYILIDLFPSWTIFVSPLSTGSDHHIDNILVDKIKCAVRIALESVHNSGITGFSLHIDHDDMYNMDIRIMSNTSGGIYNPWAMPCAEIGDDWTWTSSCW
ncbi:hypothetical protein KAFR_0I02940 [Kazachstania africana CBS 2517]|uniref:Uncharacterized protein n=1 Tax=Kazachstania africana (strain ATCC 22294 / BCRC 22015 / CBS 2517 / CECT 1963 / NBRC 1671 / NRRL Y-8276) TaxID=1071382 RepID=H2B0C3_KAZAF|nr:hypothetical protein KAFR_0I02940 [Kazachstania africana CBS 2517]CCF60073.1 hypothetical protein KAFR_0I02940 [Kazachstania africana CBS 2517]